jgi:hypothetical protein
MQSKSSPLGSVLKFAAAGKSRPKKELGLMTMQVIMAFLGGREDLHVIHRNVACWTLAPELLECMGVVVLPAVCFFCEVVVLKPPWLLAGIPGCVCGFYLS